MNIPEHTDGEWIAAMWLSNPSADALAAEYGVEVQKIAAIRNDGSRTILGPDGPIAYVLPTTCVKRGHGHQHEDTERDANAHLLAASPDLLAACRAALDLHYDGADPAEASDSPADAEQKREDAHEAVCAALRAAIRKAEGKEQTR